MNYRRVFGGFFFKYGGDWLYYITVFKEVPNIIYCNDSDFLFLIRHNVQSSSSFVYTLYLIVLLLLFILYTWKLIYQRAIINTSDNSPVYLAFEPQNIALIDNLVIIIYQHCDSNIMFPCLYILY